MATKITNPSVPEEQVSNAEDVQKTSASEAPAAELVTVAVPAEDPAGEPVAAAVGETAAEPPWRLPLLRRSLSGPHRWKSRRRLFRP